MSILYLSYIFTQGSAYPAFDMASGVVGRLDLSDQLLSNWKDRDFQKNVSRFCSYGNSSSSAGAISEKMTEISSMTSPPVASKAASITSPA